MPRFRKKPSYFEADQWFPGKAVVGVHDPIPGELPRHYVRTAHKQVVFLEPGDWVVAEPDGSGYYPIKPDIFPTICDPVE
jgi:hypothetical protein